MQLHALLMAHTSSHLATPTSPYELARTIGSSYKPVAQILHTIWYLESLVSKVNGSILQDVRCLELDATSLRKVHVGPKSMKYKAVIEGWRHKNRNRNLPQHFLPYVRTFGCCTRGSNQLVLRPCDLRLAPVAAKPPVESTEAAYSKMVGDAFFPT